MKNFKYLFLLISIDCLYSLLTFLFLFIVWEYIHDIFVDFERFKFMHSLISNLYFLLVLFVWIFFTVFIIKYNKKLIKKIK